MASAPPERVKSARLVGRPQRERARMDRSASVPRARSAGALQLRGSSGVPDFYTTSAAGPNPALITHMKMFSRRAEEARRRGRGGKVSIHDLRIEASRPPVHTPRNNPQPGAAFVTWKMPRGGGGTGERDGSMERDVKMSFYDEYRGTYGPPGQDDDDQILTNLSKLKLNPEAYAHKTTSTRSIPAAWSQVPHEEYDGEYGVDEQVGKSEVSVENDLKSESQKSVTFALTSDAKTGVESWLQRASERERAIAMDFFKALHHDDDESRSRPGSKLGSTAAALARMPRAPPKAKQPNFTLQGKKQKMTSSKDTPLLRSTSCRSHIKEFKEKEIKYLMKKMEKKIDPKKYVDEFKEKPLEQLPYKHKHRRMNTDPGTYPRSFFAQTKSPNRSYFIISPDWASENLVTTYSIE